MNTAPTPSALPAAYLAQGGADRSPDQWWTVFGDAALDAFVARAHARNFTLKAALARIDQARAAARQTNHLLPEVTANASASRDYTRFFAGNQVIETRTTTYRGSLAAAYELDLWARLGSTEKAARTEAAAVADDASAIAMTVAAEAVEAWFDARLARAKLTTLNAQLRTQEAALTLLEGRFRAGLTQSILDIYQQRSLVVQIRAQVAGSQLTLEGALARLAVLVAGTPHDVAQWLEAAPSALPDLPAVPAIGVPADLLLRRPDVRSAQRRVVAADYRVAAAIADRLPSLRLSGSLSEQSQKLTDFIAAPLWGALAALTAPLWDNGRRVAVVVQQRAVVRERLASLGQVLTVAVVEVESALRAEGAQATLVKELTTATALARDTTREARERYLSGQTDYLQVLTALQSEQRGDLALLDAERQWLSLRVRLLRALGGSWVPQRQQGDQRE